MDEHAGRERLFERLYRSLAMYLADARPWRRDCAAHQRLCEALDLLAAALKRHCQRLAEGPVSHGRTPVAGRFPTEFTDIHDLDVEYLAGRVRTELRQILDELVLALPPLEPDLREIAGDLRGHLETLEALAAEAPA